MRMNEDEPSNMRAQQWKPTRPGATLWLLLFLALPSSPRADSTEPRHGSVADGHLSASFEGGFTATWQGTNAPGVDDEGAASLDLVVTLPQGGGIWTLYLEGSTTPPAEGVSARLPEANADAGTALDGRGKGRLQISEAHYRFTVAEEEFTLGLLDPANFIDLSEVANDETRQFLASPFVNNPTIGFPDYHLAAAWHHAGTENRPALTLEIGSARGLADNGGRYGELARVSGKGIFAAAEGQGRLGEVSWRTGFWIKEAELVTVGGTGAAGNAFGAYATFDGTWSKMRWNLRGGWADARTSAAATFLAAAVERPWAGCATGLAVAFTGASSDLRGGADRVQLETYVRFQGPGGVEITPDLQWIRHSGLRRNAPDAWVAGVRFSWSFQNR